MMTKDSINLLLRSLFILPVALSALLWAADPWQKDASTWSADDIRHLLTNSPWAIQTSATIKDPDDDIEPARAQLPGAAQAGMAGSSNGAGNGERWDGGIGRNRMGHLPSLPVTVRWDSAQPVREALQRLKDPPKQVLSEAASGSYIITVAGLVPLNRYRPAGRADATSATDDSIDARNPEELLEGFMGASTLIPRGQPAIHPENVKLDPATGEVHIFFPRIHPISPDSKEVFFRTRFGSMYVNARFRLKDMKYRGELGL